MIVVSNTSPIINLASVGRLTLLQQLYGGLVIPTAVYHEIVVVGAGQAGASEVQTFGWIQNQPVADRVLVNLLLTELDEGEAEAIALALELKAGLLLLDERRGRVVAARLGLQFTGLLGVLVDAKHNGFIGAIKPLLDSMTAQAGFWISAKLYAGVLQSVGE
jgi:predicted nucleic acid-binding protein